MPPEVQALEFEAVGEGPNLQLFLIYIYLYSYIHIYRCSLVGEGPMFVCLSFSFFLSFFLFCFSFFLSFFAVLLLVCRFVPFWLKPFWRK